MNRDKLKQAEQDFFERYPEGFQDPEMVAIGKKHKMDKMIGLAQECFEEKCFENPQFIAENMVKVISRSSMVSMFEKPKFRDFIPSLSQKDLKTMTDGLHQFLYGDQEKGFDSMLDILLNGKLAKWSLITILPNYVHPTQEVFVKPTTTKKVIQCFELEDIHYRPAPSWGFYDKYRAYFLDMKSQVHTTLSPNNAAFGGFLMMSMNKR